MRDVTAHEWAPGMGGLQVTEKDRSQTIESKISRLAREIAQIDEFFYKGQENDDRSLYASMLERKRDDMVRSAVLQTHTAIEDLLNSMIICKVLGFRPEDRVARMRNVSAKALRKMLFGAGSLGFDMKLNFAVALEILNVRTKERLMELNTLRNKCSHNWLLKVPVRHGKRPRQKKPPLLQYKGRDLHSLPVLKEFGAEFGPIYYRLFVKYLA
jgi:hypothetical protein